MCPIPPKAAMKLPSMPEAPKPTILGPDGTPTGGGTAPSRSSGILAGSAYQRPASATPSSSYDSGDDMLTYAGIGLMASALF